LALDDANAAAGSDLEAGNVLEGAVDTRRAEGGAAGISDPVSRTPNRNKPAVLAIGIMANILVKPRLNFTPVSTPGSLIFVDRVIAA
jgi:hypothetical protein